MEREGAIASHYFVKTVWFFLVSLLALNNPTAQQRKAPMIPETGQEARSDQAQEPQWAHFLSLFGDHLMPVREPPPTFAPRLRALRQPATQSIHSAETGWTLDGSAQISRSGVVDVAANSATDKIAIYGQAYIDFWSNNARLPVSDDPRTPPASAGAPGRLLPATTLTRNWAFVADEGGAPSAWSSLNSGWAAQPIDGLNTQTDSGDGYWFGTGLSWSPPPKMLIMSNQFGTPGSENIDMVLAAKGAYNSTWKSWLRTIASSASNVVVVRIWQEINGNWMSWSVNRTGRMASDGTPNGSAWSAATIIAAWRNMAQQVRSVFPTALIEWNLNSGGPWSRPTSPGNGTGFDLYPGDDVVDVIGIDSYEKNASFGSVSTGGGVNLTNLAAFAKAHNKLVAWSETAAHDCDGSYLASIAKWFDSLGSMAAYFSYYDQGSAGNGDNTIYTISGADSCPASSLRAALNASSFGTKPFGGRWSKILGK
jgi:hypothetical protein